MAQALPVPRMTADEFLAFQAEAVEKYELYQGEIFAMAGARQLHEDIAGSLYFQLYGALRGAPRKVHKGDTLVAVSEDTAFYPDLVVFCDPRDMGQEHMKVRHPKVIVEVLSPSTADWDRGGKFDAYRELGSLEQYVVVHSERDAVDLYTRQDDGAWRLTRHLSGEGVPLSALELEVPVDQIYEGVDRSQPVGEAAEEAP